MIIFYRLDMKSPILVSLVLIGEALASGNSSLDTLGRNGGSSIPFLFSVSFYAWAGSLMRPCS